MAMASLMYGAGAKDRIRMLPESRKAPLKVHLKRVKAIQAKDLADGWAIARFIQSV